jgi:tetratricopeptide (TPR) repeat protein
VRAAALDDASTAYAGFGNLDLAEAAAEQALELTPPHDPGRAERLSWLAERLRERHDAVPRDGDLTRLVELCLAAVDLSAPDAAELPMRLGMLGGALRRLHIASGDPADLDEAIAVLARGVSLAGADPVVDSSNLAVVLRERYELRGNPADLDEAIDAAAHAAAALPVGHEDVGDYLAALASYVSDRHDQTGDIADLEKATEVARLARDATADGDPALPKRHTLLSVLALDRYRRTGRRADLDESVTAASAAVTGSPPGSPSMPGYLNNLGNALRLRFEATVAETIAEAADESIFADLHRSVDAHRRSVELAPADAPDRALFLTALGNALVYLALIDPGEADIGAGIGGAVEVLDDAVALTPHGSPHRALRLNSLASALSMKYDRDQDVADCDRAVAVFREACVAGVATNLESALVAARNWQRWAGRREAWSETVEAGDAGLRAAALLHRTQLLREHQLAWRRTADGIATAAALAYARVGDPRGSVAVLDGGRALLLADTLRRDRVDLAALAMSVPALAARYTEAAGHLRDVTGTVGHTS